MSGIFDDIAELYDRARPEYPSQAVNALVSATGLLDGCRVLEVGPGTGQLTLPLAQMGCAVTAVELGPGLAAVARGKLAAYPSAEVVVADFEDWPLPQEPFDAVVSATAWHWIDPAVRMAKAARALRPGGHLSVITTHHVAGGSDRFFEEVQACYLRWQPGAVPGARLQTPDAARTDLSEFTASPAFAAPAVGRFLREVTYTAEQYTDVLRTYSGHLALGRTALDALLADITELIDTGHGGRVTKAYLHEVITAERK